MNDFESYVRARSAALARSAYLLTGDVHHAEDLLQETLTRVADRWTVTRAKGRPDTFVRKVMYHRAVDVWQRRPRQRAVLVLRFYEDCTEAETAEILDCSVNTVKSQTRHALGRL